MSTALIVRDDSNLAISFTNAAISLKNEALALSGVIGRVSNDQDQEKAVSAQSALKEIRARVEKARKEAKEPVLEYGRSIDAAAKGFCAEIDEEMLRVSKLTGDYVALQQMKARAEEQARNAKLLEIEREKARELAKAKSHEQAEAVQEHFNRIAAVEAPQPEAPTRAEGQRVTQDWDVSVIDIWALARAHPGAVRIEPLIGQIKAMLNAGVKVAGVKAERIVKSDVRVKQNRAIEV